MDSKIFSCKYCLPVTLRDSCTVCEYIAHGNMPQPSFCPHNGKRCEWHFEGYKERDIV